MTREAELSLMIARHFEPEPKFRYQIGDDEWTYKSVQGFWIGDMSYDTKTPRSIREPEICLRLLKALVTGYRWESVLAFLEEKGYIRCVNDKPMPDGAFELAIAEAFVKAKGLQFTGPDDLKS